MASRWSGRSAARAAWAASGRQPSEFVAGCRVQQYGQRAGFQPFVAFLPALLTPFISRSAFGRVVLLVGLIGATVYAVCLVSASIRGRRSRQVFESTAIPLPVPLWRWSPPRGAVVAVSDRELVTWVAGIAGTVGPPIASMPLERLVGAEVEHRHRAVGGAWVHLTDVDGHETTIGVGARDVDAAEAIAAAVAR